MWLQSTGFKAQEQVRQQNAEGQISVADRQDVRIIIYPAPDGSVDGSVLRQVYHRTGFR